ncbi:uncharacterized protein BDZ99DRAFT_419907 [Mytilinidion resinicola]|uniref:DUF6987 domain-containing protein n=1 Tax=Mytilinidion resinicola TaxID=574789 RepID=A0A6A6YL08_9PEZI|nr:uncharacterized protein BDZ99DRAFT_419907 [Mytilinidion resinicola]KAF2808654.1 hypothetical protein BDZ99DRAFT_419907 [Mytilinidion resinicola]
MPSNSSPPSYAYYSFPPTPNRISPITSRSRRNTPQTDRTSHSHTMPSPAAGKGGDAPRTPTKLGRKPQSSATSKLGQGTKTPPAQKSDDNAPSTEDAPEVPERPSEGDVKGKAGDAAKAAEDTKDSATSEAEDTTSKVSQKGDLEEAEPKPIDDDDDALLGRQEEAEETGDDATEKAGDEAEDTAEDTADDATDTAGEAAEGGLKSARGLAGKASGLAGKASKDPAEAAKEGADDAQSAAGEAADEAQSTVGETTDGAEDTAGEAAEGVKGAADEAKEGAEETVGEAKEGAEVGVDGVKDTAEETTGQELPDTPDLSILKGLEVNEEGLIKNADGKIVGKLVEGDAEDLAGYTIGDDGEILDDDGDLVGRCEITPEYQEELTEQAKDAGPKLPGLDVLKGLTVDASGQILNEDGDFVGILVEGNPADLQDKEFNENGEILDDDGNVIGRAKLHPDAADLVDQDGDLPEGADGVAGEAGQTVDGAKEGAVEGAEEGVEGLEDELPGVEALEGKEINEDGEILNEDGEVIGQLAEGNIDDVKGLTVNEKGEVVDAEGNVLGKVELAEGAAEKLKEAAGGALDIRILEGLKVNKKGKVLDEEGEEIGELKEGEIKDCAGKTVNEKGEVVDKEGKVLGKVDIVPGEAAFEAQKALKERLGEAEPQEVIPELDILEGLKVNKKGQILNEDGEPIGELVEGDLAACAGKKVNEKGEVLDKDGNVIGKVKTLPQQAEEAVEGAEETAEGAEEGAEAGGEEGEAEEAGPELPPLSILEGLTVNKAGKLVDSNGTIVGELIEGDAKKLSKSGITADAEGQFWDNKGHVIGRAQTVPVEEGEEEAPFAGLEGLIVVKDGLVEDENGNTVGKVVEGDAKKLIGRAVDEDGDIIDKKGSVVGHAERYEEPEEEAEAEPEDLSILAGKVVNKQGNVIGDEGVPIGRLVEGNAKDLAGKKCDENGQIWNDSGKVIGRVELIPLNEREVKPEGIFAGLEGLRVVPDGKIADEDDNIVGYIVEGNPKRLIGLAVDEDGDILDKYGNVKGHAEPIEDEEEVPADLSILDGLTLNKQGFLVNSDGIPVGRLVEGTLADLAGRKSDGEGLIHNDTGKVVGRCELIPENERVTKKEGPFAGLEGLRVVKDGFVEDGDGNRVGQITEGDPKKLIGNAVDEDGDIIDKYGNVKGHAEPWEEEEAEEVDLSALAGCIVNKAGNVVDSSGTILGRVAEGDPSTMVGKKVDGKGQIWDNEGNVIGRAELVKGAQSGPEGPFAGFDGNTVAKDGTVQTPDGTIIGRVIEGDVKRLVGHTVDEDGDINDKNGNVIGKAERWEPEEKERKINPMAGLHVNKEGEVRDQNGDIIGRLTAGDLGHCAGLEIDDNGYVIDNDGNKVGEVTLLENIQEEEEETDEEKKRREDAELAEKMANICQQTLERIQPVCKQITEYIEQADRTPRDELDEEELVNNVKPLIEEGGRILNECNGSLRGLDPDGRIAAQAKGRAGTKEATPEEYRLADLLKELTGTVVTCIDNAKKKISDMPHAKKKLNPLWALLTQPLFQIIAAVGLLLTGVLGLVGQLLNGLGLGGLVNGLLGGLGIDKLLGGLGLGSIAESLGGGKDKKKKGGPGGLPVIGGLLGGGK